MHCKVTLELKPTADVVRASASDVAWWGKQRTSRVIFTNKHHGFIDAEKFIGRRDARETDVMMRCFALAISFFFKKLSCQ